MNNISKELVLEFLRESYNNNGFMLHHIIDFDINGIYIVLRMLNCNEPIYLLLTLFNEFMKDNRNKQLSILL